MDRFVFLRAQKWLSVVDNRPQAEVLDKIFAGGASFHVSLEENYKGKDANELKGALAPDALFIKFDSNHKGVSTLQMDCAVYRTCNREEETSDSNAEFLIDFEGSMFVLDRSHIRYIVSSSSKVVENRSPAKPSTSEPLVASSPSKRQKQSQRKVVSVLVDGITLNLVDVQSFGTDELIKVLKDDDPGSASASLNMYSDRKGDMEYSVQIALEKWLGSMDVAINTVDKAIEPLSHALNALGRDQIELKDSVRDLGEPEERGDQQELTAIDFDTSAGAGHTFEKLNLLVAEQKERERLRHSNLIRSILNQQL
jgi:hypothetical protein